MNHLNSDRSSDQQESNVPVPFSTIVKNLPATTPFVGPETLERQSGKKFRARIGANESAFGLSPLALDAMRDAIIQSHYYADPESHELRQALAEKHRVDIDEICVDAGIDSLLGLTVRMLLEPSEKVVTSHGAYPTLNYHVAGFGANLITVPYKNCHEDPDALIKASAEHGAKLVYLSNPDNPMGTWHNEATVTDMIKRIPDNCVLALDEAYIEFAENAIAPAIDASNPQVIRYRTFSKAYGMAGQRIGYVIAHKELITGFNKIRNHFGVNRIAQLGALASLKDSTFLTGVRATVSQARARVVDLAHSLQLTALPSSTNFVAVNLGSSEVAKQMIAELNKRRIFMRMPGVEPLNQYIRVGLGTATEHQVFAEAFSDLLQTTVNTRT